MVWSNFYLSVEADFVDRERVNEEGEKEEKRRGENKNYGKHFRSLSKMCIMMPLMIDRNGLWINNRIVSVNWSRRKSRWIARVSGTGWFVIRKSNQSNRPETIWFSHFFSHFSSSSADGHSRFNFPIDSWFKYYANAFHVMLCLIHNVNQTRTCWKLIFPISLIFDEFVLTIFFSFVSKITRMHKHIRSIQSISHAFYYAETERWISATRLNNLTYRPTTVIHSGGYEDKIEENRSFVRLFCIIIMIV